VRAACRPGSLVAALLGMAWLLMAITPARAADPTPADVLVAAYTALGGRAVLGPPRGPAFTRPGENNLYLATTRALIQAPLDGGPANLVNTMDWLSTLGKDDWLLDAKGIPRQKDDPTSYPDLATALQARRAWMTQPEIAAAYDSYGQETALQLLGLPTSLPERHGPFVAQRFQRGVLQLWVDAIAGAPDPGTVVPVLVGDLLAEAGLIPNPPQPQLPPGVGPGDVLDHVSAADAVAITFDMGSIDDGLPGVLDALQSRGVKGTFFLTGDFVRHYEWAVPKLLEMGEEIANHTVTHPDLTRLSTAAIAREVDTLDVMLAARGAPPPVWFRPPFGAWDRRVGGVLAGRGYPLVMWRLDLADWRDEITTDDVIRIAHRIQPGDIVVTHGGLPKTAAAMPTVLDELAARGLRQVTLSELYRSRSG
jgi:peptidoglycan/xylan/chitin deacetylase (PgdA/CDA1 family)